MKKLARRILAAMHRRLLMRPYKAVIAPLLRDRVETASRNFERMVVVLMDGGLGSQMWQYALGRAACASGLPVRYDLTWYERSGRDIKNLNNRAYRLEYVFPLVKVNRADPTLLRIYQIYFDLFPGTRFDFDEAALTSGAPRYLGGYYVNAEYIDRQGDSLRDVFDFQVNLTPDSSDVLSRVESEDYPAALHIRRGDYVGSIHDVTTPSYFREAVRHVADRLPRGKAVFFVFSNGMDWSREVLSGIDEKFVFVENNDNDDGEVDMFLMSRCRHFIISNSSFSWWPAWLSRRSADKIVVMPDVWLSKERACDKYAMKVKDWIAMPVR
ncbi:MAG: alpha-1,2-fucosyltransferase [Synergistaceae bacterium]|jgi:hypothetical protein|nr:alpha-1,2-fucosyltransferase [Synergistaceae bacterium]